MEPGTKELQDIYLGVGGGKGQRRRRWRQKIPMINAVDWLTDLLYQYLFKSSDFYNFSEKYSYSQAKYL